ncbi:serine hydrolase domain-containing protein [Pseudoxanthomonas daejeonensis]|uniref:Serine hydrolase n=1 Tax=Pseudoxanthomonas daejeonensis TaxID=266062 RepID=A0ABQ6Z7V8_9GAMM|nr:serine hydrolase domain-containing protein [Pseudoxanthomonas daejeonensis]KAF1695135.1 serine hydrolase [Pseudoxanthomonas daejeonensis]
MRHRLRLAVLLSCAFAVPTMASTATDPTDRHAGVARIDRARLDQALRGFVDSGQVIGVSALVYQDGREAYAGAFGLADREAGRPMTRDTLVRIYSMTKPVTGVALMQLYEQGKFQLDDPVSRYLPEFAGVRVYAGTDVHGQPLLEAPARPISIRDLMRHTAGFVDGEGAPGPVGALYRQAAPESYDNTLAEQSRRIASVPLLYQPGTRWVYSPAVEIQARLVEVLSGQSFKHYLDQHVLGPLKMRDTRYRVADGDRGRVAALYRRSDDGVMTRDDHEAWKLNGRDTAMTPGSWGLVSSLDDYMRFARMLLDGGELDGARILQPATLRLMASDAMPAGTTDRSWLPGKGQVGFGIDFAVRTASPARGDEASGEVGEFFWDGAANTLFWVDPTNRIAAVLFAQWLPFGKVPLHKAFRDAVYLDDSSAAAPRD